MWKRISNHVAQLFPLRIQVATGYPSNFLIAPYRLCFGRTGPHSSIAPLLKVKRTIFPPELLLWSFFVDVNPSWELEISTYVPFLILLSKCRSHYTTCIVTVSPGPKIHSFTIHPFHIHNRPCGLSSAIGSDHYDDCTFASRWQAASYQLSSMSNKKNSLLTRWTALPNMCSTRTRCARLCISGPTTTIIREYIEHRLRCTDQAACTHPPLGGFTPETSQFPIVQPSFTTCVAKLDGELL